MRAGSGEQIGLALVHGAELGAWVWDRTVEHLRCPALAVDLPGRDVTPAERRALTLEGAEAGVADRIGAWRSGPLGLVVHSFAGVLVPGIVERLGGRVRTVVWIGATVPRPHRSWVDLQPAGQRLVLRALYAVRPAGVRSPERQNRAALCNDLDDRAADEVVARLVPEAPRLLLDRVGTGVPDGLVHHYVRLGRDRAVPAAQVQASVDRLPGAVLHDLDTGHLPMISQPSALAALLDALAATP